MSFFYRVRYSILFFVLLGIYVWNFHHQGFIFLVAFLAVGWLDLVANYYRTADRFSRMTKGELKAYERKERQRRLKNALSGPFGLGSISSSESKKIRAVVPKALSIYDPCGLTGGDMGAASQFSVDLTKQY